MRCTPSAGTSHAYPMPWTGSICSWWQDVSSGQTQAVKRKGGQNLTEAGRLAPKTKQDEYSLTERVESRVSASFVHSVDRSGRHVHHR